MLCLKNKKTTIYITKVFRATNNAFCVFSLILLKIENYIESMENIILATHNLTKKYGDHIVLDNLNINIKEGDIYGFVGRNGAGKTTLIRVIAGLVVPTSGTYEINGISSASFKINKERKKTFSMVESPSICPELTAIGNMRTQCLILGKNFSKIKEILEYVNLGDTGRKKAGNFSLGMRQRLYIAMSLIGEPNIMLLDEPINGLDPEGIKDIRELLLKLNKDKKITILISSHILSELELLANRYGFIDKGRVVKEATYEEIIESTKEKNILICDDTLKAEAILKELGYTCLINHDNIQIDGPIDIMNICKVFLEKGIYLKHHSCSKLDLESYFLNLVGA